MKETLLAWLGGAGAWAWHTGVVLFLLTNAAAVLAVVITRDRALVNRWTGRWLAANAGILALGAGVPAVTGFLRLAFAALPSFGTAAATLPK